MHVGSRLPCAGRASLACLLSLSLLVAAGCERAALATGDDHGTGAAVAAKPVQTAPAQAPVARDGEPLPSPDAPLAGVVDALVARAARGDARAACRLAMEYDACEFAAQAEVYFEASLPDGRYQTQGNVDFLIAGEARAARMAAHCDGVEIATRGQRFRYMRDAARAGHLPSMVDYAMGRFAGNLAILEELAMYRDDAEGIAQAAGRAGSLTVLQALASAYAPRGFEMLPRGRLAEVVTPDIRRSLAYQYYIRDAIADVETDDAVILRADTARAIAALERMAGAGASASARTEADVWRGTWQSVRFDGRGRLDGPALLRGAEGPAREKCDDETFVDR